MKWQEPGTLEAWASSIAADVYRTGLVVSKRMDILLGHNIGEGKGWSSSTIGQKPPCYTSHDDCEALLGAGVHLSMWGKVDAFSNAADMVLGIPAHTLRRFGARTIQEDFVYQIKVGGTAQSPEIDWLRCVPSSDLWRKSMQKPQANNRAQRFDSKPGIGVS